MAIVLQQTYTAITLEEYNSIIELIELFTETDNIYRTHSRGVEYTTKERGINYTAIERSVNFKSR